MLKKPEQRAWVILIIAFLICIGSVIGTPLSIRWYIMHSTRPLSVLLQPRSERVTRQQSGSSIKALVSGDTEVFRRDRITLSNNDSAFLLFYEDRQDPEMDPLPPFITVQFYGDTEVSLESAQVPRFAVSTLPHTVILDIERGANTHITIEENRRSTRMLLQTPHGVIEIEEGIYSLTVEETHTEFSVADGHASIQDPNTDKVFVLTSMQRTELTEEGMGEIRVGEQNIMRTRNGNFEKPLEGYWEIQTSAPPGESGGAVNQAHIGNDRQIILFERHGFEPAKTAIIQEIDRDIRGATSLRVRARIRVDMQKPQVCGSLGTECPIMILMYMTDLNNNETREWLQGFYAEPGEDTPICYICDWQAEHIQVPQALLWYDYESEDLLPLLREQGFEPSTIKSIEINASGHTYGSAIDEVAILIGEN